MNKFISASLLSLFCISAPVLADPSPFGLALGKASVGDLKKKFSVSYTGKNRYSDGDMYNIETSGLPIDGITEATAIFNNKKVLVGVLLTTHKSKFDSFYSSMRGKYREVSKQIPFVGSKSVEFVDGDSQVFLKAPHMSFSMSVNYVTKKFYRAFTRSSNEERKRKANNVSNNL
jgi:hypothetical protein